MFVSGQNRENDDALKQGIVYDFERYKKQKNTEKTMSTEIQIFKNSQFGEVRVAEIDGKPYFMAYDVAKSLGYAEPKKGVQLHCKSGRLLFCPHANGVGGMQATFISESDVYRLIMNSTLPSAEKFQDWVFDEVLPAIRRHGGYLTPEKTEELLMNPDLIIDMATNLKRERQRRLEAESTVKAHSR